jgi:recombination protein RecT
MTTPATTKQLTPIQEVCVNIERMAPQFEQALIGSGVSKERFIRTTLQGIQSHRDKDKLASANRASLYLACQKAAQDGLILDNREAALVVFGNEVGYLPMVQGLVKLARNSGEIAKIAAEVVYSKDKFTYRPGMEEAPLHEPDWFAHDRGEPVGVWATVTLKTGEVVTAILPKKKVMAVASKSKNGYQYDPAKGSFYDEWWKKTAIRNVLKYAPKSTQLARAMEQEDEADFQEAPVAGDFAHDPAPDYENISQDPADHKPAKKETRAARAVKGTVSAKRAVANAEVSVNTEGRATITDNETGEIIEADYTETPAGYAEEEVPI